MFEVLQWRMHDSRVQPLTSPFQPPKTSHHNEHQKDTQGMLSNSYEF